MEFTNPYLPNEPVASPDMLFGRQDAIDWLERQLENNVRVIMISGLPQIGKTSLIKHAGYQQPFEAFNIYISLYNPLAQDDKPYHRNTQSLIDTVLRLVVEQLATQLRLLNLVTVTHLDMSTQPGFLLRDLVQQANQNLGQARLVIHFDDLHLLLHDDMSLPATFLTTLSTLLDDCPALHLIFTLNQNQRHAIRHPLIDRAPTFTLGPLSPDACINMITLPIREVLRFDFGVTRRIAEINSQHPYYLTLFCHVLVNRQMYDGWVNQRSFADVLAEILENSIEPFTIIWDEADRIERAVLAGMATMKGIHGPMTIQEIIHSLDQDESPTDSKNVIRDALQNLTDRSVLVLMGEVSYRFQVELFRFWLQNHTNPTEVLDNVNWQQYQPPKPIPEKKILPPRRRVSLLGNKQWVRVFLGTTILMACLLSTCTTLIAQQLGFTQQIRGTIVDILLTPTPIPTLSIVETMPTGLEASIESTAPPTPTPLPTVPPTLTPVPVQVITLPSITFMARDVEEGWKIYTMNSDGSEVVAISPSGADDRGPIWSPGGDYIAFISQEDGNREIYVMTKEGQNRVNLTKNQADDWTPAWSPDGRQLAFSSIRSGRWEIYLMDMDCLSEPSTCPIRIRKISNIDSHSLSPAWSPDGNQLVFSSRVAGDWDIYIMNVNGSNLRQITTSEANELAPAWSPNGQLIAYESDEDGNVDIYTINTNGSNVQNISDYSLANDHGPTWSPDSQQLVFFSNREGNWDVFVTNLAGTNLVNLTNTATRDEQTPAWRP